jgi:polyribonucleotide nucleotidyltransferase
MNKVLSTHRPQMSEWAPTIITMKIDPEKIREVTRRWVRLSVANGI